MLCFLLLIKRLKENLKSFLTAALKEQNVLEEKQTVSTVQTSRMYLTYEQQKDLLLIEMKFKEKIEQQKIEARHDIENKRLELERYKLDLINAGKISRGARRSSGEGSDQDLLDFDVVTFKTCAQV